MTIWLLMNAWWLLPALAALGAGIAVALGVGLPALRSLAKRVPALVWQALAAVVAVSLASSWLIGVGEDRCEAKQEKAEAKADVKAAGVAKKSNEAATEARTTIRKESSDAQSEARVIVRNLPTACAVQPDRLRELGESAVEAASRGVPAGAGR